MAGPTETEGYRVVKKCSDIQQKEPGVMHGVTNKYHSDGGDNQYAMRHDPPGMGRETLDYGYDMPMDEPMKPKVKEIEPYRGQVVDNPGHSY